MYEIIYTHLFKKQLRKVLKQGVKRKIIEEAIDMLADKRTLPARYRQHKLKGNYEGMYEIHIKPDLLLIYSYWNDVLILELVALGSHSELF